MCQAGFTEAGWAVEQNMVKGFTPGSGCGDSYFQIILGLVLSGKIGKAPGSKTGIKRCILSTGFTRYNSSYFVSPPWPFLGSMT